MISLLEANEQKSSIEERISVLDYRIAKLEGSPASDEEVSKAEGYVDEAFENANTVYSLVKDSSNELFSSNSYNNRYMHSIVTTESEKLSDNLMMFAIGTLAGLVVGIILWGVDAFIIEFKNARKANETKEAK